MANQFLYLITKVRPLGEPPMGPTHMGPASHESNASHRLFTLSVPPLHTSHPTQA